MPSTEGLRMLVRGRKIDARQWVGMIEARGKLIKSHLDSFTLSELGDEILGERRKFLEAIAPNALKVAGDKQFSLKTQGIFCKSSFSGWERVPESGPSEFWMTRVWGLTRSGKWILATIEHRGKRGYQEPTNVEIIEADVPMIISRTKENPKELWEKLGNAVKIFAKNRKRLYDEAENIASMVRIEELAFSLISG
jgi:hypothetical protein